MSRQVCLQTDRQIGKLEDKKTDEKTDRLEV